MIPIIANIVEKDRFDLIEGKEKTYFSTEIQVGGLFIGGARTEKAYKINTIELALADAADEISSLMKNRNPDLSLYSQPEYLVVYKSDKRYKEKVYGNSKYKTNYRHPKIDKKQIVNFMPLNNKSKIEENDIVTISSLNEKINLPMIKVIAKNDDLGFVSKNMVIFKKSFVYFSELQNYGFKITEALRKEITIDNMKNYVPKVSEKSLKPVFPVKPGSIASLYESYNHVASVYEYLESRRQSGDIFLDQWMVDAYKESKESMKNIKKLINTLESS